MSWRHELEREHSGSSSIRTLVDEEHRLCTGGRPCLEIEQGNGERTSIEYGVYTLATYTCWKLGLKLHAEMFACMHGADIIMLTKSQLVLVRTMHQSTIAFARSTLSEHDAFPCPSI